jgi:flagellar L-ring protein precursor FlgH
MRAMLTIALLATLTACGAAPTRDDRDPEWAAAAPIEPEMAQATPGSIYRSGYDGGLFADQRARNVGDILTVVLVERTNARTSASTSTKKDSSTSIDGPTLLGRPVTVGGTEILNASLGGEREFSGSGDSAQSNRLEGNITVTVAQRLSNGNLVIRGQKRIALNRGEEFVRIQGIVRPADIATDNTIASSRVADARIVYSGKGELASANSQGWLSRFFNSVLHPF